MNTLPAGRLTIKYLLAAFLLVLSLAFFGCGLLGTIYAKYSSHIPFGILSIILGSICVYSALKKFGFDPLRKFWSK